MPSRLDRGGSLGGLRRGASYGVIPGSGENASLILSESTRNADPFIIPTVAPGTIDLLNFPIQFATQHVYATFDCEIDGEAVPGGNSVTVTMRIDGSIVETRTISDLTGSNEITVGLHMLLASLTPGVHTIDVQMQATVGDYVVPSLRNRLTIIVLPG